MRDAPRAPLRGALRRLAACAAFVACALAPLAARADGRAELEKARAAYLAHNYKEAEDRLRALVSPEAGEKDRAVLSQARMYLGASLLANGRREEAGEVFEKLILEDPTFEPDPLSFPGDVINTFIDVRAQLRERIRAAAENAARVEAERRARAEKQRQLEAAWLAEVKRRAQEDKTTVRHSRLVALLPFGAGQFQNGDKALGWMFLGTEAALVVASAITLPMYAYAGSRAAEEERSFDVEKKAQLYRDRQDQIRVVNLGFVGAFAAIAGIGILQANLAFVPEKLETKKRPLPPAPVARIAPVISATTRPDGTPAGLFVGLTGATF